MSSRQTEPTLRKKIQNKLKIEGRKIIPALLLLSIIIIVIIFIVVYDKKPHRNWKGNANLGTFRNQNFQPI